MTPEERTARCAWLRVIEEPFDEEIRAELGEAFAALPPESRAAHGRWRSEVLRAVEVVLRGFCPGGDPECCDEQFWPREAQPMTLGEPRLVAPEGWDLYVNGKLVTLGQTIRKDDTLSVRERGHADEPPATLPPPAPPRIPEATIAEFGYFESIGRTLGHLPARTKVRVLTACLVAHACEDNIDPEVSADEVDETARRYQARLRAVAGTERYDGKGLLRFAFPLEDE